MKLISNPSAARLSKLGKLVVALLLSVTAVGCASQAALQYEEASNGVQTMLLQKALTPNETVSRLIVPEGFRVKVFASEPDIRNPIAFSWDERGRLWVLESTNYPHESIGAERGDDRITICEDTDGDGKADKFTRFAENQPLSTALMVVNGGLLVGQAPDIVFMEDTDGDDKMDRKTPVLDDAFGSFDTHAVMNNFKYGIDNHIWSAVGYSGLYNPGEAPPPGQRNAENESILPMGLFRFSRDGQHLEPIGRFNNNTWGFGLGEDNTIFGSTANNNHAVVVGIPMRFGNEMNVANVQSHFLIKHSSERSLQQVDYRDGYTAAAGSFHYAGRRYPQKYWGAMMVGEPTGHLVHTVYMEPDGAIFKEQSGEIENLLSSSDEWVAPVFADIGPDENIWVADWYNPVIQHNPDRRGMFNQIWSAERGEGNAHLNPLRDKQHGRIYIVEYTGNKADAITSLDATDNAALIRGLKSTNQFWRLTAQRLIVENQKTELVPQLIEMVNDQSVDAIGLNTGAIHALWTLHGLDEIDQAMTAVEGALSHPSAGVRKAAMQVLPATTRSGQMLMAANAFSDVNLNTRLAAVLAVADMGDTASDVLKNAAKKATNGGDDWIQAAVKMLSPEEEKMMMPPEREPVAVSGMPAAYLTINAKPEEMSFQQVALNAYEGQPLKLVFNNLHPDLHNVVLLKKGVDVDAFGKALEDYLMDPKAIDTNYIPPAQMSNVVAATEVLSYEGSDTVEVEGLEAGEYVYLCTVPGHWQVMQGVLTIEPAQ